MTTYSKIKGASIAQLCRRLRAAGGPLCAEAAERIEVLSTKLSGVEHALYPGRTTAVRARMEPVE